MSELKEKINKQKEKIQKEINELEVRKKRRKKSFLKNMVFLRWKN